MEVVRSHSPGADLDQKPGLQPHIPGASLASLSQTYTCMSCQNPGVTFEGEAQNSKTEGEKPYKVKVSPLRRCLIAC